MPTCEFLQINHLHIYFSYLFSDAIFTLLILKKLIFHINISATLSLKKEESIFIYSIWHVKLIQEII